MLSRIVIKEIGNMLCESFVMLFERLDGIKRYVIDIRSCKRSHYLVKANKRFNCDFSGIRANYLTLYCSKHFGLCLLFAITTYKTVSSPITHISCQGTCVSKTLYFILSYIYYICYIKLYISYHHSYISISCNISLRTLAFVLSIFVGPINAP